MPGVSGTFDHVAEMSHIINHSRKQQKSATITLVDLKNAFGEVHYSIILCVLRYHYIPDEINRIFKILYSDFRLSVITNDFYTYYIAIEMRVLQAGSFSLSIFNLIKNTVIQFVKEKKITNFGYRTFKGFLPRKTGFSSRMTLWQ